MRLEGEFNYIVVGAGTAGCIVANRLSADSRNRVLLLAPASRGERHLKSTAISLRGRKSFIGWSGNGRKLSRA